MQICRTAVAACLGVILLMLSAPAQAQYHIYNLVSNQLHQAPDHRSTAGQSLGISAERHERPGGSVITTPAGRLSIPQPEKQESLKVLIPTAGNGPVEATGLNGPGTPTGIVYNGSKTDFQVSGHVLVFHLCHAGWHHQRLAPG